MAKEHFFEKLLEVRREELKKFLAMFAIGSCVIFNFIMLRITKESLVISSLGSNAMPNIKLFVVLPASIAFMFLYTKLSNYYSSRALLIMFVSFFGAFFGLYAIFLANSKQPLALYAFYTLAECWGTVAFGTAMWAFFNDICPLEQAKRFYVLISGAQAGSLVASGVAILLFIFLKSMSTRIAIALVAISSFSIILITLYSNDLLIEEEQEKVVDGKEESKDLEVQSIFSGLILVFRSGYLRLIFLITLCYNLSIGIVEFIWKKNVEIIYPGREDIFFFNAKVSFCTTLISSVVAIIFATKFIEWAGVAVALAVFPAVFGLMTSFYFFLFMTPGGGATHWIVSKVVKYSFADPAKQVLFIPQSPDERHKSKSVIDIFGARGGKALASIFNIAFLKGMSGLGERAAFSYPPVIFIVAVWFVSSISVGIMFRKKEVLA